MCKCLNNLQNIETSGLQVFGYFRIVRLEIIRDIEASGLQVFGYFRIVRLEIIRNIETARQRDLDLFG